MKHYIAMSGLSGGYLPDYCNVHRTYNDAIDDLLFVWPSLEPEQIAELKTDGVLHIDGCVLSVEECTCNEPFVHQEFETNESAFYREFDPLVIDGKYKPVITVVDFEYHNEFIFVFDSQDVTPIKDYIGESTKDYDSFFVYAENGDYVAVYGMSGIVPDNHKTLELVYPVEVKPTKLAQDDEPTVVLFRMWKLYYDDLGWNRPKRDSRDKYAPTEDHFYTLIAVFPEEPCNVFDWRECESYQHIGQHGACLYENHIKVHSRAATVAEYTELKSELESLGYKLLVADEITPEMIAKRRENWRKFMRK